MLPTTAAVMFATRFGFQVEEAGTEGQRGTLVTEDFGLSQFW